jgi:cytochrome c
MARLRGITAAGLAALVLSLVGCAAAPGDSQKIAEGNRFVLRSCAGCHAVAESGDSRNPDAPPFRTLAARLPGESLDRRLEELAAHGHRNMPPIYITQDERRDVAAYIRALAPSH